VQQTIGAHAWIDVVTRMRCPTLGLAAAALLLGAATVPAIAQEIDAARAAELVRMVRQDCGSCHGMRLTGGLGPALTRDTHGRPAPRQASPPPSTTAAPARPCRAGKACSSEADARWIAGRLQAGFPLESEAAR
jgi:cytochrome c55X